MEGVRMIEALPGDKYRIPGPLEVEYGDVKQAEPMPQMKVKRWSNEVNFSLRLQGDRDGAVWRREGDQVIWERGDVQGVLHYSPDGDNTRFKFDVVLVAPPASNVLTFSLQHKGLRFLYQPPLNEDPDILADPHGQLDTVTETEARAADGKIIALRPAEVVGSWAAYHATRKDNQYKSGKAFHIFRPFIFDAVGQETWGLVGVDLDKNLLTVTIPPSWLAKAVYPVTVDPDLGDTTVGGSGYNTEQDTQIEYRVMPEDGTLNAIYVHCRSTYTYSSKHFAAALFNASGPTSPGSVVHEWASQVVPYNGSPAAWEPFTGGSGSLVNGSGYMIAACGDSNPSSGDSLISYDSGGSGGYDLWRDVVDGLGSLSWDGSSTRECSMYATYTATGGGPTVTFPAGMMIGV